MGVSVLSCAGFAEWGEGFLSVGWDGKIPLMDRIHQAVLLPDLRLEGKVNLRQGVKEALSWV